jgi:hypothetical protein
MLARNVARAKLRLRSLLGYYFKPPRQPLSLANHPAGLVCDPTELGRFVQYGLLPIVGSLPYPPNELMLMSAAMVWLRPALVIEWGTNIGVSARVFYEVSRHYDIGAEIHSIDIPSDTPHFENPRHQRGILVHGLDVKLHVGDGLQTALNLLSNQRSNPVLIFLDGDHSKSSVLREASGIWRVNPDCPILFHDTFPSSDDDHGPRSALKELVAGNGSLALYETQLGRPGMTFVVPGLQRRTL